MKIYIAGNISTDPDYFHKFEKTEMDLVEIGHAVINPVKNLGFDYKDYIDMGLAELSKCEAIYLLKGYENSKGALLEKHYAETVGLKVLYQQDQEDALSQRKNLICD